MPRGTAASWKRRYAVRLIVPRRGGWRAWGAVRADLEHALADPVDPAIASAEIASDLRRGADYVRVTIALTIFTTDVADVKRNQPLLHAQVRALPWRKVPVGGCARDRGHGRAETRTVKAAHVSRLDFPGARQAIKITRWRQDIATGRTSRETAYAVTSLTSADATAQDLARLVREHWSIEAHHHPGHDVQRRHFCQPYRQRARQPSHHPRRRHRGHQRRRLPAHP